MYVCVFGYVQMHEDAPGGQKHWISQKLVLQVDVSNLVWGLGTKLGSSMSRRAANFRAISLAPYLFVFETESLP